MCLLMIIGDLKEQRVYVKFFFFFKIWKLASEMSEIKPGFLHLGPKNQTVVLSVEMPIHSTSANSEACYFENHGHIGQFFLLRGHFL
jgi:hypothetical protein